LSNFKRINHICKNVKVLFKFTRAKYNNYNLNINIINKKVLANVFFKIMKRSVIS